MSFNKVSQLNNGQRLVEKSYCLIGLLQFSWEALDNKLPRDYSRPSSALVWYSGFINSQNIMTILLKFFILISYF